jgi:hypothetical protein
MKSLNKQRTLLSVSLLLAFALLAAGLDLNARGLKVRPGDDFFHYALGAWDAPTAIAPDQTEAGVDVEVFDRVQSELRDTIEHSGATSTDSEALIAARLLTMPKWRPPPLGALALPNFSLEFRLLYVGVGVAPSAVADRFRTACVA